MFGPLQAGILPPPLIAANPNLAIVRGQMFTPPRCGTATAPAPTPVPKAKPRQPKRVAPAVVAGGAPQG
jgi:hypothetical protein